MMAKRQEELKELKQYIENIEKETTLLLQNLQWDHKRLLESPTMVSCKYVSSHRILEETREDHEKQCYLVLNGYGKKDLLLPDPIYPEASTVVKLCKRDIQQILNTASLSNPSFRRACGAPEPLSLERLQVAYTGDERHAIYDAVVSAAPNCHDLTDLALVSSGSDGAQSSKVKSRAEILSELRDMKRRRAKYRVAAKTTNYSDVLRDVIKTQMELYSEAKGVFIKTEYGNKSFVSLHKPPGGTANGSGTVPPPIIIKQERISPERDGDSQSSRIYRDRSRTRNMQYDKHRRIYGERDYKKRRHGDHDNSSERRYRDVSPERTKYTSKERRRHDDSHSREKYEAKDKEHSSKDRNRPGDFNNRYVNVEESSASHDDQRHKEDRNLHSKHEKTHRNGSSETRSKYESNLRESDRYDRSCKDDYYHKKREYYKSSKDSDTHKERKNKRHHEAHVKEEKYAHDSYSDERKRRK